MSAAKFSVENEFLEIESSVESRIIDVKSFCPNDSSQVESFFITTWVDSFHCQSFMSCVFYCLLLRAWGIETEYFYHKRCTKQEIIPLIVFVKKRITQNS